VDTWFSVGKAEMHLVFLAFRTTKMEQNAHGILESLIESGQVSSNLGFMHLPPGMSIPTRGGNWYPLVFGLPLDEDMEALLTLYFKRLKEQLGYEPERFPPLSPEMAQIYINIALDRDAEQN